MNEIDTVHGTVTVYSGGDRVYLKADAYVKPTKERPVPELVQGPLVRLSIDEARIIAKAILRSVADAELHLEFVVPKLRKGTAPFTVVDFADRPAFTPLDPAVEASNAQREAALMRKERESVERMMAEAKQRKRRRGPLSKAAKQILAGTFPIQTKRNMRVCCTDPRKTGPEQP